MNDVTLFCPDGVMSYGGSVSVRDEKPAAGVHVALYGAYMMGFLVGLGHRVMKVRPSRPDLPVPVVSWDHVQAVVAEDPSVVDAIKRAVGKIREIAGDVRMVLHHDVFETGGWLRSLILFVDMSDADFDAFDTWRSKHHGSENLYLSVCPAFYADDFESLASAS
jgi:hypothetical protein